MPGKIATAKTNLNLARAAAEQKKKNNAAKTLKAKTNNKHPKAMGKTGGGKTRKGRKVRKTRKGRR